MASEGVTQVQSCTDLFGKFAERALAPKHYLASRCHLGFKIGGSCTQLYTPGCGDHRKGFTHLDIEVRQKIAG